LFLVPLLRRLAGRSDVIVPRGCATLGRGLAANDEREDYLRATLSVEADGTRVAQPLGTQDSSMMSALARADCLIVRKPFAPKALAGESCTILELDL
jgi:molybdopterin molybdotransferase